MPEVKEQMMRLETAREKANELSQNKSRISGELEGHKKRLGELEKRCKDDFDCSVAELPAFIESIEKEAEGSLQKAEVILEIRKSEDVTAEERPKSEKPSEPEAVPDEEDEDALV